MRRRKTFWTLSDQFLSMCAETCSRPNHHGMSRNAKSRRRHSDRHAAAISRRLRLRDIDTQPGADRRGFRLLRRCIMLQWTLTFLVIAIVAGLLGFGALEGLAMWIAKTLFVVFLILFLVSLISGRRAPMG